MYWSSESRGVFKLHADGRGDDHIKSRRLECTPLERLPSDPFNELLLLSSPRSGDRSGVLCSGDFRTSSPRFALVLEFGDVSFVTSSRPTSLSLSSRSDILLCGVLFLSETGTGSGKGLVLCGVVISDDRRTLLFGPVNCCGEKSVILRLVELDRDGVSASPLSIFTSDSGSLSGVPETLLLAPLILPTTPLIFVRPGVREEY